MTVGADTEAVTTTLRDDPPDPRRARRQHVPRRLERLLRPAPAPRPQRRLPADGDGRRADQRDHVDRRRSASRACAASDLLLGHDAWGASWIAAHRARQAAEEAAAAASATSPRAHGARRERGAPAATDEPQPADGAGRVRLRFLPDGAEVRVPSGTPVFDAASWNGIAIDSTCGGHGTCKKCKVRIVSGEVPVGDRRPAGVHHRRAARGLAAGLPRRRPRRPGRRGAAAADAAEGGAGRRRASRDPAPVGPEAPPGARGADAGGSALGPPAGARRARRPRAERVDRAAARRSAAPCERSNFDVTAVVCDEELIDVEPGDTTARRFAIAFDLGTTTVVATLLDLDSGQPVAVRSMLNRQQPYGADVITRISATMMDDGRARALRDRAHETLAELTARGAAPRAPSTRSEVYEITVCGNVTMMQLALGIDPEPLSMAPFVVSTHAFPPVTRAGLRRRGPPAARRRSCSPRSAPTSAATSSPGCSPPASRATGGCGCSSTSAPTARSRSAPASGCSPPPRPAGPAFEAAQIKCGMRAADGAIEGVRIDGDALDARGDRRRRAGRDVRLGPRRRGRRARPQRPARPLRALHPRRAGGGRASRRSHGA